MIQDKLYNLAFEYKKTNLWKKLLDSNIFAVKLSDGKIGYCSVMGMLGEFISLGLYIGDKGWNSYLLSADIQHGHTKDQIHEVLLAQDCIQCVFENKDSLCETELYEIQQYAKTHKINFRGSKSYPQFVRYNPYYYPWYLEDSKDQDYLCEALNAALEVAKKVSENEKKCTTNNQSGGIPGYKIVDIDKALDGKTVIVPLLTLIDDKYVWSKTELPIRTPVEYPTPLLDDLATAKIKKLKKSGKWECEIFHFDKPFVDEDSSNPYFPVLLLVLDTQNDLIIPMNAMIDVGKNAGVILSDFVDAIIYNGKCPAKIAVRNRRTEAFLADFCRKTGISMIISREMPMLQSAKEDLLETLGRDDKENGDELKEIINMLMEMDEATLMSLPTEYLKQLKPVIGTGILPPDVEKKLKNALQRKQER